MIARYIFLSATLFTAAANAGDSSLDAAIGGGLGGAAGAAIGNEIGGRDGAIVGGALGAAVGTAVSTDPERHYIPPPIQPDYHYHAPSGNRSGYQFCPPGQAKKNRC
jgi:Glycine zipper 2TM domain